MDFKSIAKRQRQATESEPGGPKSTPKVPQKSGSEPNTGVRPFVIIKMPRKNGLKVCQELRAARSNTPVLMLTARDEVEDRITGLDAGADDYLIKPFS